jgi:hypothetical protein
METTKNYKPRRRIARHIPFGYKLDPHDDGWLVPVEVELDALNEVMPMIRDKVLSLSEATAWLEYETGRVITNEGLRKRVKTEYEND